MNAEITGCFRSSRSYSELWADDHPSYDFVNETCAGYRTGDVLNLVEDKDFPTDAALVSMTIGGNDEGFGDVMDTCDGDSAKKCLHAIDAAEAQAKATLPAALKAVLTLIRYKEPHAKIVVMGYPEMFDTSRLDNCPSRPLRDTLQPLNKAVGLLDELIEKATVDARDKYADVRDIFKDHVICDYDKVRWMNYYYSDLDIPFHPNADGQKYGYLPVFTKAAK